MAVIHFSKEGFDKAVAQGSPMLVDFWASWCGPCKMLAPTVDKLAEKYDGKVIVGKVDVDDFSNYFAEMDGGTAATFRITRFGFGRGNYQTMEIYGSRGAIQYELDHAAPDVDEIYVCMGEVGQESHTFTKLPLPDKFKVDQMQSFADIILGKADGKAATIEDGRVNQHLVDAVIRSGETGEWETL